MAALSLTGLKPAPGDMGDANLVTNAFTAIEAAVNQIDATQFAAGKIFALNKLAQTAATTGQLIQWNGVDWVPASVGSKRSYAGLELLSTAASTVWETASAAILVPFFIDVTQTLVSISFRAGATQSGNYDVGVYNAAGTRMVSKGSTAQSTLSVSAVNTIALSVSLPAGQYYLALVADNITGTFWMGSAAIDSLKNLQLRKVLTSFPLPSTIVPGATLPTNNVLLTCALS